MLTCLKIQSYHWRLHDKGAHIYRVPKTSPLLKIKNCGTAPNTLCLTPTNLEKQEWSLTAVQSLE